MSQTYANSIEGIRRSVAQTKGDEAQSLDALSGLVKQSYEDKLNDFKEKWQGVEQVGGAIGQIAPTFRTGMNIYNRFKSLTNNTKPNIEDESTEDLGDINSLSKPPIELTDTSGLNTSGLTDEGEFGETSFSTSTPRPVDLKPLPDSQPTSLTKEQAMPDGVEDDPFQSGFNEEIPVRSSFQQGGQASTADDLAEETSQNLKSTISDAVDAGSDALGDAGLDVGSYLTADAISSSIPIIGEAVSVIGSLATIGVGIGELLGHKTDTPQIHPVALSVPTNLTAKYSDSLPSADGVIQRASSSSVF